MPIIDRPRQVRVTYSEKEIRDLIIRDLAENHAVRVRDKDIEPLIVGGGTYREIDDSYSGGFNNSSYERVEAAKFNGYVAIGAAIEGESEIERDAHLAAALTEGQDES